MSTDSQVPHPQPSVVAQGATMRQLQFPSPIYFSEWVSDSHLLVGAGGGGQRFGMANVIALLRLTALAAPDSGSAPQTKKKSAEDGVDWALDHALDLGDRVPWCCTSFLPARNAKAKRQTTTCPVDTSLASLQKATTHTLLGTVITSHMESFSLIRVCAVVHPSSTMMSSTLMLESSYVVPLEHDGDNPDKKCVAAIDCPRPPLVRAAFRQATNTTEEAMMGEGQDNSAEDADEEAVLVIAAQDDGVIQPFVVPAGPTFAAETADDAMIVVRSGVSAGPKWDVGCRANDISLRLCNTGGSGGRRRCSNSSPSASAEGDNEMNKEDLQSELGGLVIVTVAAMQDKHIYVAQLQFLRSDGKKQNSSPVAQWSVMHRLDGAACGLPFPIMRGSLKFARIVSSQYVLLVAYDANTGNSYMNIGTFRWQNNNDKDDEHHGGRATEAPPPSRRLLLFPSATAVLGEGITACAPLSDTSRVENASICDVTAAEEAIKRVSSASEEMRRQGDGGRPGAAPSSRPTPLPRRWIFGTVDGSIGVVGVRPAGEQVDIELIAARPPMHRSGPSGAAVRVTPSRWASNDAHRSASVALHQEPISSVSVAPGSGGPHVLIVSTDIAQKLIFSVITPSRKATTQKGRDSGNNSAPPEGKQPQSHVFELYPPSGACNVADVDTRSTTQRVVRVCLRIVYVLLLLGCLVTAGMLLHGAAWQLLWAM